MTRTRWFLYVNDLVAGSILMMRSEPGRDPDELEVLVALWRSWRTVAIATGAALALAIVYLHLTTHEYTAELKVVPTTSSTDSLSSRLGNIASLASLAGISGSLGDNTQPFQLYLEGLHSQEAADALAEDPHLLRTIFHDEWDSDRQTWRAPNSLRAHVASAAKRALGVPASPWSPPDGARLREYLRKSVEIRANTRSSVVVVSYDHSDPAFAVSFLTALDKAVDGTLRRNRLQRSKAFIDYLIAQLNQVTVIEHRQALSALLGEEERSRMLASSGAPIAAQALGRPVASPSPTKPRVVLVAIGSMLGGAMLGTLVAVLRVLWRRGTREPAASDTIGDLPRP